MYAYILSNLSKTFSNQTAIGQRFLEIIQNGKCISEFFHRKNFHILNRTFRLIGKGTIARLKPCFAASLMRS